MQKKYILFDNDGVLVETEKWYYEANVKALAQLGVALDLDVYLQIMARGGTAWEVATKQGIPKQTIDQQRIKRDGYYQEFLQTKNITIPGVKEVLAQLQKSYRMGIVTTARRVDFDLIHSNAGIVDYMDFSLCVEEYPRAKPYPDPYLAGLEKFGAKASESLVIEDSQRGLSSAKAAGIECAIVHNDFTANSHDFRAADYFIDSLQELPSLLYC